MRQPTPRQHPKQRSLLNHRTQEIETILQTTSPTHITGPRGTGKTTTIQTILNNLPPDTPTSHINCRKHRTEYRALQKLHQDLYNIEITRGKSSQELRQNLAELIQNHDHRPYIFLDDTELLTHNDSPDLLRYLTQETHTHTIYATTHPDDNHDRINPIKVKFEPYNPEQANNLLKRLTQHSQDTYTNTAIKYLTENTQNIEFAQYWLYAAKQLETPVTRGTLDAARTDGNIRYHHRLIRDLTPEHTLLTDVIHEQTTDQDTVETGELYEAYKRKAASIGRRPRTKRRITDLIKELELLDVVQTELVDGGFYGRARTVSMKQF